MSDSTPPPVPTEDYIENLWKSVILGHITWDDLTDLQSRAMPRCVAHDEPANVRIGRELLCAKCITERIEVSRHAKETST